MLIYPAIYNLTTCIEANGLCIVPKRNISRARSRFGNLRGIMQGPAGNTEVAEEQAVSLSGDQ